MNRQDLLAHIVFAWFQCRSLPSCACWFCLPGSTQQLHWHTNMADKKLQIQSVQVFGRKVPSFGSPPYLPE